MYLILKIVKKWKNYSVKGSEQMGLLKTITIGIIALIGGLFVGIILYVIFGGETTNPSWENWMYVPCYIVPFSAFILGIIFGRRIEQVNV